jgi:hypothetical protein
MLDGLIIPAMGARIGAQIAQRIPASRKMDVFSRFMDDPEFARFILEKGVARRGERLTAVQARNLTKQLNNFQNYLTRSGLIASAPLLTGGDLPEGERASFTQFPDGARYGYASASRIRCHAARKPRYGYSNLPKQSFRSATSCPECAAPSGARASAAPWPASRPTGGGCPTRCQLRRAVPERPIASILQQREMQQGIGSLAGPR